jgi:hypothetical protein
VKVVGFLISFVTACFLLGGFLAGPVMILYGLFNLDNGDYFYAPSGLAWIGLSLWIVLRYGKAKR